MRTFCAMTLLVWMIAASGASIYRWVDAEGQVHYTDRPPAAPSETIDIENHSPGSSEAGGLRPGERALLDAIQARERAHIEARDASAPNRSPAPDETRCRRHRARASAIEARLRRGYRPAEGEALERELAEHRAALRRECP